MKLFDLNPYIRFAYELSEPPIAYSVTKNYDCRLFFVNRAEGSLFIGSDSGLTEHILQNNMLIYLPPATRYRLIIRSENSSIHVFHFDPVTEFLDAPTGFTSVLEAEFDPSQVFTYELPSELSAPIIKPAPELKESLSRCMQEVSRGTVYAVEMASAQLKPCLIELVRGRSSSVVNIAAANAAIEMIQMRFADPAFNNTKLSAALGYHPNYLNRIIKQTTGKPLHKYLTDCRMKNAKMLLMTTDADIAVLSKKSGFNSASYFTKIFREETGLTPKEFRRLFHT